MSSARSGKGLEISGSKSQGAFQFGKNWANFLHVLNEEHIAEAEKCLKEMLEIENLEGLSFLDIGSGSGLHSLAARKLGAKVYSFDYDAESVACALTLKDRYYPGDPDWIIERGSVLDKAYMERLGSFDVVYSWGVLHHTGAMWPALGYASNPLKEGGKLFVAIYNDQGKKSRLWKLIKKGYNVLPSVLRKPYVLLFMVFFETAYNIYKPHLFLKRCKDYKKQRGMSIWHDWVDWIGGYPFEVAKPEEIFDFYKNRGCVLTKLKTMGGSTGCNQFVFMKPVENANK
ncbi:MAG: class I SAM-dependent methyltransferase [Nitrospiraceae bacterium]|nr:class I SAM-dependent methyltransferase [Nitrospiraceae bacterium]